MPHTESKTHALLKPAAMAVAGGVPGSAGWGGA
eukprot:SAG22_NODE_20937_length_261_cov_0.944444_1_plen_32_part_10